ncbi:MAG: hypothetical protein U1E33_04010 [Rhodospirillales bacterium]
MTANLLTGQKQIALEVVPGMPPATMTLEDDLMVIPSVPSETERITGHAGLPRQAGSGLIAQLVTDLRNTVQDAGRLLGSPSLRKGIDGVGPLLDSLNRTTEAAKATSTAPQPPCKRPTMRWVRSRRCAMMARLLERTGQYRPLAAQPDGLPRLSNALILGKPAPDSQ